MAPPCGTRGISMRSHPGTSRRPVQIPATAASPALSLFTNDVEPARVDVCGSSERADPEPGPPALSRDQRQDSREPALGASLDEEQVCVRRKGAEIRAHPFRPVEGLVAWSPATELPPLRRQRVDQLPCPPSGLHGRLGGTARDDCHCSAPQHMRCRRGRVAAVPVQAAVRTCWVGRLLTLWRPPERVLHQKT